MLNEPSIDDSDARLTFLVASNFDGVVTKKLLVETDRVLFDAFIAAEVERLKSDPTDVIRFNGFLGLRVKNRSTDS
jgi:hypothetical protein